MIRILALSAALLCVAPACKSKQGEGAPQSDEPAGSSAGSSEPVEKPVLKLEAAKLVPTAAKAAPYEVTASGEIKIGVQTMGRISADGKLTDADGTHIATIDADGNVTIEGSSEVLTVSADGKITKGGARLVGIDADGILQGAGEIKEKVRYEGPDSARRLMMYAFLAGMAPMIKNGQ